MSEVMEAELVTESNNSRIIIALMIALLIIGAILLALAGDNVEQNEPQATSQSDSQWRPFSVIAPIDTGINVYKVCDLTFNGSWQERYDADKTTCWDTLNATDIVYFPGTKIIGASPDGDSDILILDDPNDGHGSAVTGAVLDANPNAVIFFVECF